MKCDRLSQSYGGAISETKKTDMASMSKVTTNPSNGRLSLKVFAILVAGGVFGSLANLPYVLSLTKLPPIPMWQLLLGTTLQALVLMAVITGLGLWLGGKVGLGAPLLKAWLAGDSNALHQFQASLPLSLGAGAIAGVLVWLLENLVFRPLLPSFDQISIPAPWQGFLASFYGGITEELLCRLGLMTLLVWLGTKLTKQKRPGAEVMWIAIALTALLFGALHLPIMAQLTPLTSIVVTRVLLLNGFPGVLFGWLYWRKGLEAAMVAHFSADIILHVIAAALP